ncbi:MAG: 2-oxoacid:acceptor oxidoreductase family protein, partial [Desulfurococcaceae archaeon]
IVGRGGQGVLLFGRVLGLAASKYANLYAVVTESYAAETRGGESRSDVIIANSMEEIPYVKVTEPDIAVFLYPFKIQYYKSILKQKTLVVVDEEYVSSDLFKEFRVVSKRFSELAEKNVGTRRVANVVILGRILREIKVLGFDHVKKAIEEVVPAAWIQLNLKALDLGYNTLD